MDLNPDKMPQSVGELITVTSVLNHLPGCRVNITEPDAWFYDGLCRTVGLKHQLIYPAVFFIGYFPAEKGPCHVSAVTVLPAPHIQKYAVPPFKGNVPAAVVANGRIGPKTHGRRE